MTDNVPQNGKTRWNYTSSQLPDEGIVVNTISPSGMESFLKRQGNLWFYPDGSMYVYYTPQMWRLP